MISQNRRPTMNAKQAKYPQLRFKGFTDPWVQSKLGEVGKTQSGIGFPDAEQGGTEGVPFYKVSDMNKPGNEHEMVNANNYVNYEQLSRKKWKIIETVPAVIFAKVGAAIMLNRKRLVTSPFLIDNNTMAYVFDGSWNIDFGKTLFETINLPRYAQVGALPSYNGSDIESIEVTLPNKGEQVKLGAFFKSLDDNITLHQRKLDLLKEQKKGYLQKMFPKNGAKVPELRFAGFADAWEQRKLIDLLNQPITDGPHETPNLVEKGIPFISADAIVDNRIDFSRKRGFITEEYDLQCRKKYGPELYDVYLVKSGSTVGKVAIVETTKQFNIWSPLAAMRCKGKTNPYFLYFLFQTKENQNQVKSKASNGTQPNLSMRELEQFNVQISPLHDEQQKIGAFFKQLDSLITLHQRKLEKLQELKKGYLQKMFV